MSGEETHRVCTKCLETYPLDIQHFKSEPRCRNGLSHKCRGCLREYYRLRKQANAQKFNAEARQRRAAAPEKAQANERRYRERRKLKEAQYQSEWQQRFRDLIARTPDVRTLFPRFLSVAEAAAWSGVQVGSVYKRIRDGRMKGVRQGKKYLVLTEEVLRWQHTHVPRAKRTSIQPSSSLDASTGFHESVADPNAINPLQAVLRQERLNQLLTWVATHLAEEEQAVLLTYAEADFDEKTVAQTLGKPLRTVQSILRDVQQRAVQTFGGRAA